MNVLLIGCGGGGGFLAQLLAKHSTIDTLYLQDGDLVEKKNLDRQFFGNSAIGKNKAEALAEMLAPVATCRMIEAMTSFFSYVDPGINVDWIFVSVDNSAARVCALHEGDRLDVPVIIGANEYDGAEAYVYLPAWKGSKLDPRVYYPEMLEDHAGDPLSPCTGEAQVSAPQLAIFNHQAISFAAWLWYFWGEKAKEVSEPKARPVRVRGNFARLFVTTEEDFNNDKL